MLSKCANPECSEILYLHAGKIFYLAPTPDIQIQLGKQHPALHERFWLCARCSKEMTLEWGGTQVKVVHLPAKVVVLSPAPAKQNEAGGRRSKVRVRPLAGKIDEVSAAREVLMAVAELNTPLRTSNANGVLRNLHRSLRNCKVAPCSPDVCNSLIVSDFIYLYTYIIVRTMPCRNTV